MKSFLSEPASKPRSNGERRKKVFASLFQSLVYYFVCFLLPSGRGSVDELCKYDLPP
jgi:hypothetical protein